jgi:hypothetical protein
LPKPPGGVAKTGPAADSATPRSAASLSAIHRHDRLGSLVHEYTITA